jgi:hypothetical protein
MKPSIVCVLAVVAFTVGCGGGDEAAPLVIAWKFSSGDCASNAVSKVRVTITPDAGETKTSEFACADGRGDMGVFPAGSYGILSEGLDATGKVVAQNFGASTTFGDSGPFGALEVTLNPKAADVVVTWKMSSGGNCPPDVQLPYFIAIYKPPATAGGMLTEKVKEVQVSCATGTATLASIAPGNYVVELDSRAVTPKVKGTKNVTVKPGENAQVAFQF